MTLDSFEISLTFPVGDRFVKHCLFGAEKVGVMVDHFRSDRTAGKLALLEQIGRGAERTGNLRQIFGRINVPFKDRWRLDFVGDAEVTGKEPGNDSRSY